jgi:hypothetical protein
VSDKVVMFFLCETGRHVGRSQQKQRGEEVQALLTVSVLNRQIAKKWMIMNMFLVCSFIKVGQSASRDD